MDYILEIAQGAQSERRPSRAVRLVSAVRSMRDDEVIAELKVRRDSASAARVANEKAARRERAEKAATRLHSA